MEDFERKEAEVRNFEVDCVVCLLLELSYL